MAALLVGRSANAGDATWNGTTDATWATGTNWSATPVPGTGNIATFNNAGGTVDVIDLGAGVTISGILFDTASVAAYTIGSGAVNSQTLTLNNSGSITANNTINANQLVNAALVLGTDATVQSYSITNNDASNSLTFAGTITGGSGGTAGVKTLTVNTAAGNVAISGAISNGGATAVALTKSGAGTLTLTGNSTYSGGTTLSAGLIRVGTNDTALGSGTLTVSGNATLATASGSSARNLANAITINASTTLTLDSGFAILTLSGNITGSGNIAQTSSGTAFFSGTNSYAGTTTVGDGSHTNIYQFTKTASLYNSTPASWTKTNIIVKNGATLALNVGGTGEFTTGNVTTLLTNLGGLGAAVTNNGFVSGSSIGFDTTNASGGTFTVADNIVNSTGTGGGAIGLNKYGTNTLVLSGANAFTGATGVVGGTLKLGSAGALGNATNKTSGVTVTSGAVLDFAGFTPTAGTIPLTLNGTGISSGGALTNSGAAAVIFDGPLTLASASSIVAASGGISLTNDITNGANGLTLLGPGNIQVNGIIGQGATPTGTLTIGWTTANSTTPVTNVTLTGNNSFTGNVSLPAANTQPKATLTITNSGALGTGTKTVTCAGATTGSNGGEIHLQNNITLASTITFTTSGPAIISDSGTNTINGKFNLTSGSGDTTIASTAGSLTLGGTLAPIAAGRNLVLNGNGDLTVLNTIGNGTGNNILVGVKRATGVGTLTLSGTNTYTCATTVSTGTLVISSDANMGASYTGSIQDLTFTAAGAGLTNGTIPLTISAPPAGGVQATGTATVAGGVITGVTLTNAGSGYLTAPTIGSLSGTTAGTFAANVANLNLSATLKTNAGVTSNRAVALTGTGATINTNGFDSTFSGPFTGAGALTKSGTGSLILSGASTYSGGTSVTDGNLRGTGTLSNGLVTVTATGSVWPGTAVVANQVSGVETFTVNSVNLTGGKLKIALRSDTNKQLLNLTGPANSSTLGGTLSLGFTSGANTQGADITILTSTTPNAFGSTTFTSCSLNGQTVTIGSDVLITYGSTSVSIQIVNGVTPVKIADFSAKSEGSGVNVSWKAISEYQNAGFNVYRRSTDGGEWTLVNPALIAGRVTNPDEKMYSFFDWASSGEWQYKLESIDIAGGKETYEQFAGPVSLDWNSDLTVATEVDSGSVATVNDGFAVVASVRNAQAVSATIASMKQDAVELNNVAVREVTAIATSTKTNVAARSVSSLSVSNIGVRWFSTGKVGASSSSVAKVVYSTPGVMVIPQNSMPNGYDLNNVTLQREGRNMSALAKVPAGLLVYAPGYADDYTDKDAVFIRKSTAATNVVGAPTSTGLFNSSAPVNVTSPATVTNDYHDVYFDYSTVYRPFSFAPWFSSKYLTQGTTQDFTVTLPQASSGPATLTLNLWSLTSDASINPDHALQLVVNGTVVSDASWDGGDKMMQLSFTIPSGVLNSGDNTVSLVTPTLSGVSSQVCFVHSISADYTRLLDGSKSFEIVNNSGKAQLYELNNVPSTGAWVVDTRFSDRASLVASETLLQADGTLRLRFMASAGGSGKFVVTPVGQENAPISITSRLVKAAKLTGTYLATGPLQFSSGVQPLLTKRSKEGIRGTYFDQEALFDYYNYGRYGPDGIRNAVRSLKPKYLLLVGRTTYDYRNYEGKNIDPLCPAYLVSTSFWAQTTSDSLFGDLGRGYPEVAVGRLPVNNTTELSGAISHILGYTGIPQSGLRLHAVADQADPLSADFGAQLDTMVKANNPDVTWQENYLLRTYQSAPEVTDALKTAANGGADLILYSGHGNAARLGNTTTILDATLVQQWTGNTVFLQSTCTANWMAKNVDDYKSIAIQAMTQAQGGISASVGTSTYMNPDVATAFMNQLIKNTNQGNARWGNALLSTQQWAGRQTGSGFYTDLMNTEQLFGDPAMPVFAPKSINTAPSNTGAGTPVGTF